MRRSVRFWLILFAVGTLAALVRPAYAGNVDFTCTSSSCGTVTVSGGVYSASSIAVTETGTAGAPNLGSAFTLAFNTGTGVVTLTGPATLTGSIVGPISLTGSTGFAVAIFFPASGLPISYQTFLCGSTPCAGSDTLSLSMTSGNTVTSDTTSVDLLITPVPEPASMLLFGSGLLAVGRFLRRRRVV